MVVIAINIRFWLLAITGLLALAACAAPASTPVAAPDRPSVEFIEFYSPM